MKPFSKTRLAICAAGACLLVLLPFAVIRRLRKDPIPPPRPTPKLDVRYDVWPALSLSPDGAYLAAIRLNGPSKNQKKELVVWRTKDRKQLSLHEIDREAATNIQWQKNDRRLATVGRFSQLWNPLSNSPKALSKPIKRLLKVPMDKTDLSVESTWVSLDNDLKVLKRIDGEMDALRVSTGTSIPLKFRWKYTLGAFERSSNMALLPPDTTTPVRAFLLRSQPVLIPRPPLPPLGKTGVRPRAVPRTSFAPALYRQPKSLLGETIKGDLASFDATPRISAPQRGPGFPPKIKGNARKVFSFSIRSPKLFRAEVRDLVSDKVLWQRTVMGALFDPAVHSSPDGRFLVLVGTSRPTYETQFADMERGIDILDSKTGHTLHNLTLDSIIEIPMLVDVTFLSFDGPAMAIREPDSKWHGDLKIISLSTGKTLAVWPSAFFEKIGVLDVRKWSSSADGSLWAFCKPNGWVVLSRSEIEAQIKALTVPTPTAGP